jgi:hypothetical protein
MLCIGRSSQRKHQKRKIKGNIANKNFSGKNGQKRSGSKILCWQNKRHQNVEVSMPVISDRNAVFPPFDEN